MKKITYLIFAFIVLIFISECAGYKPIFGSTNIQFDIADYSIKGDKIIGKKIYSRLHRLSKSEKNDQNITSVKFLIDTLKNKEATIKDNVGKILEYKITIKTKIITTDFITDEKILNQTFISSLTYKVKDQHSDTIKLENKSVENLINKIFQEILIKLSHNITTK
jgi:flagellar biosynthesis chaperone FliJ